MGQLNASHTILGLISGVYEWMLVKHQQRQLWIQQAQFSIQELYFSNLIWSHFQFFHCTAENLPYFYFQLIWPNDLESASSFAPMWIIFNKLKVDETSCYRLIWHFWCYYVTSRSDLDHGPFNVKMQVIHRASRDQSICQFGASYDYLVCLDFITWLSVLDLWSPKSGCYCHYKLCRTALFTNYSLSNTAICLVCPYYRKIDFEYISVNFHPILKQITFLESANFSAVNMTFFYNYLPQKFFVTVWNFVFPKWLNSTLF